MSVYPPTHSTPLSIDNSRFRIDPALRLRRAIHVGDALLVNRILRSHPHLLHNPDRENESNSSLHLAADLGHADIVRALVQLGHEDPCPALNEKHQTALMLGARAGNTEAVHFLAQHDPTSILRTDAQGRDAIMNAAEGGHDTCVQILLTYVPEGRENALQRTDCNGNTALHFASAHANLYVVRTLLAAGADPEKKNAWSWTPGAYSATVQAEVYLKNLVEGEKRKAMLREIESRGAQGSSVRIVDEERGD